jgi:hypothetical protein
MSKTLLIALLSLAFTHVAGQGIYGVTGYNYRLSSADETGIKKQDESLNGHKYLSFEEVDNFLENINLKKEVSVFAVFAAKGTTKKAMVTVGHDYRTLSSDTIVKNSTSKISKLSGSIQNFQSIKQFKQDLHVFTVADETRKDSKTDLLEIIIFPRTLKSLERKKIETALSIKYGISLHKLSDYTAANGKKFWSAENNAGYLEDVFGIAIDSSANLKQISSTHLSNNSLSIAIKQDRKKRVDKQEPIYFLAGGNGNSSIFSDSVFQGIATKLCKKAWLISNLPTNRKDSIQLVIRDKKITEEFLQIDKASEALRILITTSNESTATDLFTNSKLFDLTRADDGLVAEFSLNDFCTKDSINVARMQFLKMPKFLGIAKFQYKCDLQRFACQIKVLGGTAPYTAKIELSSGEVIFKNFAADDFELTPEGTVSAITLTDNNKLSYKIVLTENDSYVDQQIQKTYSVSKNNPSCTVGVVHKQDIKKVIWKDKEANIGSGEEITIFKAGTYEAEIELVSGCKKRIPFTVALFQDELTSLKVYPNPSSAGNVLNLSHPGLKFNSSYQVYIYTANGSLFSTKTIMAESKQLSIVAPNVSGVYTIKVTAIDVNISSKFIVK